MSEHSEFIASVPERYSQCCAATMRWMLTRPVLHGGWLNTKMNSMTKVDYVAHEDIRGPDFIYGWIQGRGLEAIVAHAEFFADSDSQLTAALDMCGLRLYRLLTALQQECGHIYFCYQADASATLRPVCCSHDGTVQPLRVADDCYSYADIFAAKGLVAAAARYCPDELDRQLGYLQDTIAAIEDGRFQINERVILGSEVIKEQPDDFGPRMIMLGAHELLVRYGLDAHADFAAEFVSYVLERHFDVSSGLLFNVPGTDICNVGHAIEFVGFALAVKSVLNDRQTVAQLAGILRASFNAGFTGNGIALSVSASNGTVVNPICPWWSLPETIRSAARVVATTGDVECRAIWAAADQAFFNNFWQADNGIAVQARDENGPVDFVPATPDLDPGYHTGLSLLAAVTVASTMPDELASDIDCKLAHGDS